MTENGADTVARNEESIPLNIEQKLGPDVHKENHSKSDENVLAGDLQKEEEYPAVALEASNQETSGITALSVENSEVINGESIAGQGVAASAPDPYASSQLGFSVQVGAFLSRNNAERLTNILIEKGYTASMLPLLDCISRPWFTVRSGTYSSRPEAKERAISFTEKEQMLATVRPVDSL
ncbi:MAG: SPOR domain-containing protein [bacterium]|nr:SPOR domain-containing protein [bacterium]